MRAWTAFRWWQVIRINFLNSFKETASGQGVQVASYVDQDEQKQIFKEVAKRLLIIAIGPLGLYIYEMQTIPVLMEKKTQAEAKFVDLKQFNDSKLGLSEEIKRYEDEQARFNAQVDFINKIQADKVNEYKLFLLLQEKTPKTIWIDEMKFVNNSLEIKGLSLDPSDIGKFTQLLSDTDFIKNPEPRGQTAIANYNNSGSEATTFIIKASLNVGTNAPALGVGK